MAAPRWNNGPPGDGRRYNTALDGDFAAWEESWRQYNISTRGVPCGCYQTHEGWTCDGNRERLTTDRRNGNADPFEGDPVKKARHSEAVEYIRTYTGRFALILDLKSNPRFGTKWFRLSDKQVDAVLRSKEREAQWARDRAEAQRLDAGLRDPQTGRDLNVLPYGRTYAAVDNDSGGVTFLIFDRPKQSSNWHGWVFVKQQQGPNEVKLGAQRPGSTYVGQWPNLIDKVLADRLAAVARYGQELGVCGACGLPLTNDESRREGIGPVCRGRLT